MAAVLVVGSGALAHAKSKSYTGCLAAGDEAGEFKLTNVNGGSDEYELVGGKGLKDHVGHKVEIQGTKVATKAAHGAKGEKAGEAQHQHLRVKSMRHVAATCP
jgi:hypothetical protein